MSGKNLKDFRKKSENNSGRNVKNFCEKSEKFPEEIPKKLRGNPTIF